MSTKYVLKKPDGTYFALNQALTGESKNPKDATLFDTQQEATEWRDTHALHCVKLSALGFTIFKREV